MTSKLGLFTAKQTKTVGRRNDKIAAQLKECFALALIKGDFPIMHGHEKQSKLPSPVTITYVDLSPDLRNATVFYTPLGGIANKTDCEKFFEMQLHYFKNIIAKKMKMRFIPNILFRFDESLEYSFKIEKLLKQ